MASMTLAEAELQLTQVNSAIEQMMQGKLLQRVEIGSHEFRRVYDYNKVSLSDLIKLRNELLSIIEALSPDETPLFRKNATIPMIVTSQVV